jgi:hypothetical protein
MLKEAMEDNKALLPKLTRRIREYLDQLVQIGGNGKQNVKGRFREVAIILDGDR